MSQLKKLILFISIQTLLQPFLIKVGPQLIDIDVPGVVKKLDHISDACINNRIK